MTNLFSETEEYRFIHAIGKGTFGQVAKFERKSDLKTVAVKTLDLYRKGTTKMIRRETRLLAILARENLEESHIVQFFEAFQDLKYHHLVFEVLDTNLYQLQVERDFKPLAVRDIRTITFQVLTALAKLKEVGIVHADVKPENIMLVDQHRYPFRVKLVDFGSSYTIDETKSLHVPYLQTRYYRAPEILFGLPFSEKMDMWSLGCVMAEMCLGHPLYPANSEFELAHYICETQGMPSARLLISASKTRLFFDLVKNKAGSYRWRLKPTQESPSTSKHQETWRYTVTTLDQLERGASVPGIRRDAGEISDHHCMVDLLKRMLTVVERQRINAGRALIHSFVTLQHLCLSDIYQQYYELSLQGYREALINHQLQHFPSQTSAPSCNQEFPENKYGFFRTLLRSFFTCLCLCKRRKQLGPPQCPSAPLEGPHDQPGPQTDDSLKKAQNLEQLPVSSAQVDTSQLSCEKTENKVRLGSEKTSGNL